MLVSVLGSFLRMVLHCAVATRLLKIGAVVRVTVRKVWVALAEAYPLRAVFAQALANLRAPPPAPQPAGTS